MRALLAWFYWPVTVLSAMLTTPPWLVPLLPSNPWLALLAYLGTGAAIGVVAAALQDRILDRLAARIAAPIENLAAEWRKLLAAPTLPPSGGENGPAGPATERIHP